MELVITQAEDLTFDRQAVKQMIESFGDRVLQMGTLDQSGSLHIPIDCYRTGAEPTDAFVDQVIAARKAKIARLNDIVQSAATDTEAQNAWRELEHILFGI